MFGQSGPMVDVPDIEDLRPSRGRPDPTGRLPWFRDRLLAGPLKLALPAPPLAHFSVSGIRRDQQAGSLRVVTMLSGRTQYLYMVV